jgi:hypothetical protein
LSAPAINFVVLCCLSRMNLKTEAHREREFWSGAAPECNFDSWLIIHFVYCIIGPAPESIGWGFEGRKELGRAQGGTSRIGGCCCKYETCVIDAVLLLVQRASPRVFE